MIGFIGIMYFKKHLSVKNYDQIANIHYSPPNYNHNGKKEKVVIHISMYIFINSEEEC